MTALAVLAVSACTGGGVVEDIDASQPRPGTAGTSAAATPSPAIADLMAKTSMTDTARRLFLAAEPTIEAKAELERNCRNTAGAHTLGCFLVVRDCRPGAPLTDCSHRTRIHLLHIDQAETHDLIYVSAAHEMLHAAYEEIPEAERRRLDGELEAALPQLDRCRVNGNLEAYAGRGPDERRSELHSVLATEFARLPAGLQAHFGRYFANRQVVVAAHDRTLGNREQEICDLGTRLDRLDARIDDLRSQIRQLRAAGSVRASNSLVPELNTVALQQNRLADTHNRRVDEYNRLLANLGSQAGALAPRDPATGAP